MKMRIFPRILLATMLPLTLIFMVMITAVNNVIYTNGTELSRDLTVQVAAKASYQVSMIFNDMGTLLGFASRTLGQQHNKRVRSRYEAERMLRLLLGADPNFYSAWFVFEPGVFDSVDWHSQCLIKEDGEIRMVNRPGSDKAGWFVDKLKFHYPRSTSQVYINPVNQIDYGLERGPVTVGTVAYPIFYGAQVIGVVGLDVRYQDLVPPTVKGFEDFPHTLLLIGSEGTILHSPHLLDLGRNLSEFLPGYQEFLSEAHNQRPLLKEIDSPFLGTRALACVYPAGIGRTNQNFFIYLDFPLKAVYSNVYKSMRNIALISLAGLGILFLSVLAVTRPIVRPIKDLTVSLKKISKGDLNTGLDIQEMENLKSNVAELEIMRLSLEEMLAQLTTAHDISLRSAEAKIEKERLIAASETKSRFFAYMSHEIRTPMNAVLGIADIMLESGELNSAQRKYINDIKISTEALLTVINDILDLSKMEAGRMRLSPTHFDFKAMLNNLCSLAQFMANSKNLAFRFKTLGRPPRCLFGDDVRLRQVLLNLLSNAVKYTRQGSVELEVETRSETLRFSIRDTGIGIRPEDMSRLFNPFQQIDSNQNRSIQGTGLGLSICKNLTALMGGKIEVESVYGQGSLFSFIIPKIQGDPEALEPREGQPARRYFGSGLRTLVVDDNEINLTVAAGLLATFHGIKSDLAASGREALEKVKQKDYHIIFMDHMMPDLDGAETTRRIRALGGRRAETPIIAFTANAVVGIREMLMSAGFNDYLAKPINRDELAGVLNKWAPAESGSPPTEEKPARPEPEVQSRPWPEPGLDRRLVRLYQALLRLDDEATFQALKEVESLEADPGLATVVVQVKECLEIYDFEAAAGLVRTCQARPEPKGGNGSSFQFKCKI